MRKPKPTTVLDIIMTVKVMMMVVGVRVVSAMMIRVMVVMILAHRRAVLL